MAAQTDAPSHAVGSRRRTSRRDLVALTVLVGAVATSCLVGLGRRPLWLDESLSVGATTQLVDTWKFTGGTMAGYYALLTPWASVSHDRAWLRLLSVILALAVVPITYRFARLLCGRREALLASALLGGSWAFTRYAQEVRAYSLAMVLTAAAWLVLVRWAQAPVPSPEARRLRAAYTTLVVLALLSHGLTGLQVIAQAFAVGLLPDRHRRVRALIPSGLAFVVTLGVLTSVGAAEVANWIPPLSLDQLGDLIHAFTGPGLWASVILGGSILAGVAVAVGAYRRGSGIDAWRYAVVVSWALIPPFLLIAVSTVRPYMLPRYVLGSLPAVSMLMALSVRALDSRRLLVVAAVVVLMATVVFGRISLADDPYDDWARMAESVAAQAQADDVVAFPTLTVRPAFDFAWAEIDPEIAPQVISPVGPLGEIHRKYPYHGPDVVPALLAEQAPPRIWVIGAETVGKGDTFEPFLEDPALSDYRLERRENFDGGLELALLVRR